MSIPSSYPLDKSTMHDIMNIDNNLKRGILWQKEKLKVVRFIMWITRNF